MSADATLTSREEVRYEIFGEQTVMITIDPADHRAEPKVVVSRLLNLSSRGARLAVPLPLTPGDNFRLKLSNPQLGLSFYLAARVCWSSLERDQACVVGCRLTPTIPDRLLEHLAQGGKIDRRESERRSQDCPLKIVKGSAPRGDVESAKLANFAAGGICLETTEPAKLGERIEVTFEQIGWLSMVVIARWQLEQNGSYLLGCEYVEKDDFSRIESALAAVNATAGSERRR